MLYQKNHDYVVSSGYGHLDIDALACGQGLDFLLTELGFQSRFISSAALNASVPSRIKKRAKILRPRNLSFERSSFIVCDVSDPKALDSFIDQKKIVELIDHHFGFEDYWKHRIGEKADIRPVAACASQIAERFIEHSINPNQQVAELLLLAIISNSLNMQLELVSPVDHTAKEFLEHIVKPSPGLAKNYFQEVQTAFQDEPLRSLQLDSKIYTYKDQQYLFAQAEVWNQDNLNLRSLFEKFTKSSKHEGHFILNVALVESRNNIIFTTQQSLLEKLESLYGGKVQEFCLTTAGNIILRKQIKRDLA